MVVCIKDINKPFKFGNCIFLWKISLTMNTILLLHPCNIVSTGCIQHFSNRSQNTVKTKKQKSLPCVWGYFLLVFLSFLFFFFWSNEKRSNSYICPISLHWLCFLTLGLSAMSHSVLLCSSWRYANLILTDIQLT